MLFKVYNFILLCSCTDQINNLSNFENLESIFKSFINDVKNSNLPAVDPVNSLDDVNKKTFLPYTIIFQYKKYNEANSIEKFEYETYLNLKQLEELKKLPKTLFNTDFEEKKPIYLL